MKEQSTLGAIHLADVIGCSLAIIILAAGMLSVALGHEEVLKDLVFATLGGCLLLIVLGPAWLVFLASCRRWRKKSGGHL